MERSVSLLRAVERLASATNSDVYLLSAGIDRLNATELRQQWAVAQRRRNCTLVLTTWGGAAHAAYMMARFLRRAYEHVTILIYGKCKNAGTLLAIGAHELVMGVHGELGPLYVPGAKEDDAWSSGLDVFQAIGALIGLRLGVKPEVVRHLTESYSSHGFVIDLEEAKKFLENVRAPNELELELEAALSKTTRAIYVESASPIVTCLTTVGSLIVEF